jgi:hypothetical protein
MQAFLDSVYSTLLRLYVAKYRLQIDCKDSKWRRDVEIRGLREQREVIKTFMVKLESEAKGVK